MCKIGIISYYRNINFGSTLQACALQMAIRNLGYDCEHVRFFSAKSRKQKILSTLKRKSFVFRKLVQLRKKLLLPETELRRFNFGRFVDENIQESEGFYTEENLTQTDSIYDVFVCGSDQIWAPNQFNELYYLSFVPDKWKKIAYAPSIGLSAIPDNLKEEMASLIKDIGYLSIREKEGAQIVYELTGIDIPVVLDPTLLITREQWLENAPKSAILDAPYILCLLLGKNPKYRKSIEAYQQATGYKIAVLPFTKSDYHWGDVIMPNVGPLEFINLVNNATTVFTDSFHGAAFSMNLNKPFYVFMRFAENHPMCQNSRIRNLLTMFGLEGYLIGDEAIPTWTENDIDYGMVNKILEMERAKSLRYLQTSLMDSITKTRNADNA